MDHLALKFALALLLVGLPAFPYACATTQAGNWTSAATWTSCNSSIPGNGDTASIGHAVTVDANTTVGTSPSDSITLVLTINAPVTVAAAITLTVRGSITLNHNLILSAGSVLSMDPSQATIRLTAEYLIGPDDNSKWNSKLVGTACTAVARCTVQTLRPNGDEARARATMGAYLLWGKPDWMSGTRISLT